MINSSIQITSVGVFASICSWLICMHVCVLYVSWKIIKQFNTKINENVRNKWPLDQGSNYLDEYCMYRYSSQNRIGMTIIIFFCFCNLVVVGLIVLVLKTEYYKCTFTNVAYAFWTYQTSATAMLKNNTLFKAGSSVQLTVSKIIIKITVQGTYRLQYNTEDMSTYLTKCDE